MALSSYYYLFSIVGVLCVSLILSNFLLVRMRGATTFGQKFKQGTDEYERVKKYISKKATINVAILELIFIANLINSIRILLQVNTPAAHSIFIFVPLFCLALFAIILVVIPKQVISNLNSKH